MKLMWQSAIRPTSFGANVYLTNIDAYISITCIADNQMTSYTKIIVK